MASHRPHADHEHALRQRPEMASFKLLVLKFVRQYIADWNGSPSLGEIAHALGSNRTRVKRAVLKLDAEGQLLRVPGTRGLSLPDEEPMAMRQLLARGWTIDVDRRIAMPPTGAGKSVTNEPLPPVPELDYPYGQDRDRGMADGGAGGGAQEQA